jgi:hypothetical protein
LKNTTLIPPPNSKSIAHIFVNSGLKPYRKYVKTVLYMLTGQRYHPLAPNELLNFVLQTRDGERWYFDPSNDCIYTYSRQEDEYFQAINHALFEHGLLQPYDETKLYTEYVNGVLLTQEQLPAQLTADIEIIGE